MKEFPFRYRQHEKSILFWWFIKYLLCIHPFSRYYSLIFFLFCSVQVLWKDDKGNKMKLLPFMLWQPSSVDFSEKISFFLVSIAIIIIVHIRIDMFVCFVVPQARIRRFDNTFFYQFPLLHIPVQSWLSCWAIIPLERRFSFVYISLIADNDSWEYKCWWK